jgi:hypothetical protein
VKDQPVPERLLRRRNLLPRARREHLIQQLLSQGVPIKFVCRCLTHHFKYCHSGFL